MRMQQLVRTEGDAASWPRVARRAEDVGKAISTSTASSMLQLQEGDLLPEKKTVERHDNQRGTNRRHYTIPGHLPGCKGRSSTGMDSTY